GLGVGLLPEIQEGGFLDLLEEGIFVGRKAIERGIEGKQPRRQSGGRLARFERAVLKEPPVQPCQGGRRAGEARLPQPLPPGQAAPAHALVLFLALSSKRSARSCCGGVPWGFRRRVR